MALNMEPGRMRSLSGDDIADLCAQFEACDADADGRVSCAEFEGLVQSIGSPLLAGQRRSEFLRIDTDGNGLIDLAEFRRWWQGG